MTSTIQVTPSVYAVRIPPTLEQKFRLANGTASTPVTASAIVTLGDLSSLSRIYDATGNLQTLSQAAGSSISNTIASDQASANAVTQANDNAAVLENALLAAADANSTLLADNATTVMNDLLANQDLAAVPLAMVSGTVADGTRSANPLIDTPPAAVSQPAATALPISASVVATTAGNTAPALANAVAGISASSALASDQASASAVTQASENAAVLENALLAAADANSTLLADNATTVMNDLLANQDLAAVPLTMVSSKLADGTSSANPLIDTTPASLSRPAANALATPIPVAATTAGDNTALANARANGFLEDSVAQAMTNVAENPAYANAAAGLYVNAAISRSPPISITALPNVVGSVLPVMAVRSVGAIKG